jgi:hypothetical protein
MGRNERGNELADKPILEHSEGREELERLCQAIKRFLLHDTKGRLKIKSASDTMLLRIENVHFALDQVLERVIEDGEFAETEVNVIEIAAAMEALYDALGAWMDEYTLPALSRQSDEGDVEYAYIHPLKY